MWIFGYLSVTCETRNKYADILWKQGWKINPTLFLRYLQLFFFFCFIFAFFSNFWHILVIHNSYYLDALEKQHIGWILIIQCSLCLLGLLKSIAESITGMLTSMERKISPQNDAKHLQGIYLKGCYVKMEIWVLNSKM